VGVRQPKDRILGEKAGKSQAAGA